MQDCFKFPALRPIPANLMDEVLSKSNWGPWMPAYKYPLTKCVCHVVVTVAIDGVDTLTDELLEWDGRHWLKEDVSQVGIRVECWRQRQETRGKRLVVPERRSA